MGKKVNPVVIGTFILGAVALTVVAVMVWGSGKLFQRPFAVVCYFPGSVNGLAPGAPVKFRGVQIGEVDEIRIVFAQERGRPRIPVFLNIDGKRMRELGATQEPSLDRLHELIEQGLRARLLSQSIVTGVLYVDFDLLPGTRADMMQAADAAYPEVPTLPTPLEEATRTFGDILAQLKEVDWKGISDGVRKAVDGVSRITNDPRLLDAVHGLPDAVHSAKRLLAKLDAKADPLADGIQHLSADAQETLRSIRTTLDGIQALVGPDTPLAIELARTASDLGRAARGLSDLADFLERNPNAVVFGRPPS